MGIKSTQRLTRSEALTLREELRAKLYGLKIQPVSNEKLGDELDALDEAVCELEGRTCFNNYLVRDDGDWTKD